MQFESQLDGLLLWKVFPDLRGEKVVTHAHCSLMADKDWTAVSISMFFTPPTAEA
jgi:hypothetical protein